MDNGLPSNVKPDIGTSEHAKQGTELCPSATSVCGSFTRTQVEAAHAECERELLVRERCYPKWIEDGKIARFDAKDRFIRLRHACDVLKNLLDSLPAVPDSTDGTGKEPF